jgi:hypothetical protein
MSKLLYVRPITVFVLLTLCVSVGCSGWRAASVNPVSPDEVESLVGKHVRFHTSDGERSMKVRSVDYPYVDGRLSKGFREYPGKTIRVDLRQVERIEVQRHNVGMTVVAIVLVAGLVVAGIYFWGIKLATEE